MFYAFLAKTNITQTDTFMKQCIMEANSETNLEKAALRLILCDSCKQDDNYADTEHQKTILLILC